MSNKGPNSSFMGEVGADTSVTAVEPTNAAVSAITSVKETSSPQLPQSTTTKILTNISPAFASSSVSNVATTLSNACNKIPPFDLSKLTTNNKSFHDDIKIEMLSAKKTISCSSVLDRIKVQEGIFKIEIKQSAIIIPSNIGDLKSLEDILKRGHFEKMLKKNPGFLLLLSGTIQGPGELWDRILDLILTFPGRVLLRYMSAHKLETTDAMVEKMFIKMIISKFPHIDAVIDPNAKEHKLQAEDNTSLARFNSISSGNITEILFFMHNNTGSVDSSCFARSISGECFIQLRKKTSSREQNSISRDDRGNNNSSSSSSSSSGTNSDTESDNKPRERRLHGIGRNH
jgi:hypothetical protein